MTATRNRIVVDDSVLARTIGGRIRTARQAAGMTQQQLAAGRYTKAYVSALEQGHAKPSMAALDFIAARLGMPASRFLSEDTRWDRLEADLLLAAGRWAEAARAYEHHLDGQPDRPSRADALLGWVEALCRLDRGREAIAPATEAVELLTGLGRAADAMLAGYWLAYGHFQSGNAPEARSLLQALLDRSRGATSEAGPDLQVRLLMALASVASDLEDHAAAVTYLEAARAGTADLDDRRRASMLSLLATSRAHTGDTEGAIRAGLDGLALYRAVEARAEVAILENNLAVAYLRVGDLDRAASYAASARQLHEADADGRSLAHVLETEAQIALARGATDVALSLAREAMAHAVANDEPRAMSSCLLTIARSEAIAGRVEEALDAYREAVDVLRRTGSGPRRRDALTECADLLARQGRHREAFELTREALQSPVAAQSPGTIQAPAASAPTVTRGAAR